MIGDDRGREQRRHRDLQSLISLKKRLVLAVAAAVAAAAAAATTTRGVRCERTFAGQSL